jgi:hypothetical protein
MQSVKRRRFKSSSALYISRHNSETVKNLWNYVTDLFKFVLESLGRSLAVCLNRRGNRKESGPRDAS